MHGSLKIGVPPTHPLGAEETRVLSRVPSGLHSPKGEYVKSVQAGSTVTDESEDPASLMSDGLFFSFGFEGYSPESSGLGGT
jgi:hypothetical protein